VSLAGTSLAISWKVRTMIVPRCCDRIKMNAEYAKARKALGDISDDWPEYQYSLRSTPAWDIFSGFISDLPMVIVYIAKGG
jgi:hypothetical protein